jgi:hypothetical protein
MVLVVKAQFDYVASVRPLVFRAMIMAVVGSLGVVMAIVFPFGMVVTVVITLLMVVTTARGCLGT